MSLLILPFSSVTAGDVENGKRLHTIAGGRKGTEDRHVGHTAHVLCISISSDGKYLATGDMNKLIMIWEAATCKHLYKFTGHRGPVSVSSSCFKMCFLLNSYFCCTLSQTEPSILHRACLSGGAPMTCTVPLTTAPSRCGTWTKTPMWKPCE